MALLSRGYGSEAGRNDEALVLEENLPDVPHLQGADRVAPGARPRSRNWRARSWCSTTAFSIGSLHRDLDIVLIDATCPWGHGYLLPRGLLREPIGGLTRAHVAMLTRCDLVAPETVQAIREMVTRIKPELPIVESMHRPAEWRNASQQTTPLESLQDRPIAAFCGLGNPDAFRQTLVKLGLNVIAWRTFPDHHPYTQDDVEDLRALGPATSARRRPS